MSPVLLLIIAPNVEKKQRMARSGNGSGLLLTNNRALYYWISRPEIR